ncbi:MAG: glycyl-radical enzyme activating protein [Melioribacteraceae bacterium]|nr:glycyl-radical enzyme activating protein [Melioribacteraceae bacterium]MCF8265473.1 glycyl-radical enzyme activating protein [Melioribacteraceae bacterium]MCF8431108.1 glycyl-radical enzyme activating protein [Melioribacteraceae bacterium]
MKQSSSEQISTNPLIFDIKRYSINDGPGIRLTIFFKGCNLDCAWCHNPESKSSQAQKLYSIGKCAMCSACVNVCENEAISLTGEGIRTDQQLCVLCGKCAEECPTNATEISGYSKTIDELLEIIDREKTFFETSNGGITLSGGEPLLHFDFVVRLLDECKKRGIHTAIDTAGNIPTERLIEIAKRTDLFLFDIKVFDSEAHKFWTKRNNNLILKNLKVLSNIGARFQIRIPLIEGVNTGEENIINTAKMILELDGSTKRVDLLTYHSNGERKFEKLGKELNHHNLKSPSSQRIKEIIDTFMSYGIEAQIGG